MQREYKIERLFFPHEAILPLVRYRSTAMSVNGMVASSHPLSTLAGARILEKGGNAFDAAIATNAVLNVTQPHVCGIGGDAFFLFYDAKSGHVEFLNASGRASRNATIDFFDEKNLSSIPSRGPLAALEVPGCVDGWQEIHERYGSLSYPELLRDAIILAKDGFPISHQLSQSITAVSGTFKENKEWMRIYAPNGRPPKAGELLIQKDLGWSFEQVAMNGKAAYYEGEIAKKFVKSMEVHGGFIDADDFARHKSDWAEPLFTKYRDHLIYETAPNSQALTALIAFNLLQSSEVSEMELGSSEYTRLMIEVSKIAYTYRNKYITDPFYMTIKPSELLSVDMLKGDLERLNALLRTANRDMQLPVSNKEDGDTTYYCMVDKDQNCVSCIQSLYYGFGSGFIPEGTGIVIHNRGSYFSLNRKHHNALMPRKRTFHTLCASLTTKRDQPRLLFGSMGGDVQPQIHQQVISSFIDHGTDIQQAIEDPRWAIPGTIYENPQPVHFESRYSETTLTEMKTLGYSIVMEPPLSPLCGHAQGISIDAERGIFMGGADPRGDGLALGI